MISLKNAQEQLSATDLDIRVLRLEIDKIESLVNQLKAKHTILLKEQEDLTKVYELLTKSLSTFKQDCVAISKFVTDGYNEIFPNDYEFTFNFIEDADGNIQSIKAILAKNGTINEDLSEDLGDAEYIIGCFLIFLACFIKIVPPHARVIFCDEILSSLDSNAWSQVGKMLEDYCKTYGVQINMTTHFPATFGKTFKMNDGSVEAVYDY